MKETHIVKELLNRVEKSEKSARWVAAPYRNLIQRFWDWIYPLNPSRVKAYCDMRNCHFRLQVEDERKQAVIDALQYSPEKRDQRMNVALTFSSHEVEWLVDGIDLLGFSNLLKDGPSSGELMSLKSKILAQWKAIPKPGGYPWKTTTQP